jgi:hypothetical protein
MILSGRHCPRFFIYSEFTSLAVNLKLEELGLNTKAAAQIACKETHLHIQYVNE